jgi:hypothetical protein
MLCVWLWCGATNLSSKASKVQVFTKIGNNFVCNVEMTCNKSSPSLQELQAYTILRYIQDQVARNLKHDYLPSRYLAIYVGSLRLTKPDFPFVDKLDAQESLQVLGALQRALRIDVMYDEVETFNHAKRFGKATRRGHTLVFNNANIAPIITRKTLVVPELEVWALSGDTKLTTLEVFNTQADTFGKINLGPCLHTLRMCQGSQLSKANIADLVPCKALASLSINLHASPQNTLSGIGNLVNLLRLEVKVFITRTNQQEDVHEGMCIPSEIAKLSKLRDLSLQGVCGSIPKEIAKLACLETLHLFHTSLTSSIPPEIGQLSMLKDLYLYTNPLLTGLLPRELDDLEHLQQILIVDTPGVTTHGVMTHGHWDALQNKWHKH